MNIRLQIFLARAGLASSRRKAEELIKAGKVRINGKIAKIGDRVDSEKDKVEVAGQQLEHVKKKIYLMLNKPVGYLVAKSDTRGRKLAYDLLKEKSISNEKLTDAEFNSLFNVGRLDLNTEGLLLFTNEGDFALKLTHPRYHIKKVYIAKIEGRISDEAVWKLTKGVWVTVREPGLTERYRTKPATVRILGRGVDYSIIVIRISEGRKREIRRMCEAVGHPVLTLKRTQIGELELKDLPIGKWKFLTEKEVSDLRRLLYIKEQKQKERAKFRGKFR
jgi:pseudouridine synthase